MINFDVSDNWQISCHKTTHADIAGRRSSKKCCTPRLKNLKNQLTEPTSEGIGETRPQWREQRHEELKSGKKKKKKAKGNREEDDERWEEGERQEEKKKDKRRKAPDRYSR